MIIYILMLIFVLPFGLFSIEIDYQSIAPLGSTKIEVIEGERVPVNDIIKDNSLRGSIGEFVANESTENRVNAAGNIQARIREEKIRQRYSLMGIKSPFSSP